MSQKPKHNPMLEILLDEMKQLTRPSGPRGTLARLWRQILYDMQITPSRFNSLMNDFITDAENGVPDNRRDQTTNRGNFMKEFSKPRMTMPVFLKGMRFLKLRAIRIHIEAFHEDGRVTQHHTLVDLGRQRPLSDLLKELSEERESDDNNDDKAKSD